MHGQLSDEEGANPVLVALSSWTVSLKCKFATASRPQPTARH
jgi:hypothetical protein